VNRSAILGLWAFAAALAAASTVRAATVQLDFDGSVGAPYQGFVPAVAPGTTLRYQVRFEDRVSDGDYSDYQAGPGPVTGWADIGTNHYVLDGFRFPFLFSSFTGEKVYSFALTGSGPVTSDGDLFEGIFISHSSISGWAGDGLLGYRRPSVGGGASFGYLLLEGSTRVSAVPLPSTLALLASTLPIVGLGWVRRRRHAA